MTTPMLMTEHPTEELLAAFVDNRLDSATREPVTEHLTSCGECREIVLMATDLQAAEVLPENVRQGWFGRRARPLWVAAAAVLLAFLGLALMRAPGIDEVIVASKTTKWRPGLGRIAGISYKEVKPTFRGGEDDESELEDLELHIVRPKLFGRHAKGVATLLLRKDLREAVELLEKAHRSSPGNDRLSVDLAAAYIAYGSWQGDAASLEKALTLSEDVWNRTHMQEAAWNRAAALQSLGRDQEAIRAWDDYLAVDSTSQWADEARRNKSRLADTL